MILPAHSHLGVIQYGVDYPTKTGPTIPTTRMPEKACADDVYQLGLYLRRNQVDWIPRFCDALRSLGYSPVVSENYVPPGVDSCEYWYYNIDWKVPTNDPGFGGAIACGIYVTDLETKSDPLQFAKDITGNCTADAYAKGAQAATIQTVTPPSASAPVATSVLNTTQRAVVNGAAQVTTDWWEQLKAAVTGASSTAPTGETAPAVSTSNLSSIPTWAWLASGGLALYLFMGRGKS